MTDSQQETSHVSVTIDGRSVPLELILLETPGGEGGTQRTPLLATNYPVHVEVRAEHLAVETGPWPSFLVK